MKKHFSKALVLMALTSANWLTALPTLQLDILGGQFDNSTETTVATSDLFTVRALLSGSYSPGTYFLSAAITPGLVQTNPVPNFGNVVINGQTYLPTNYNYGIPPLDVSDNKPAGNLGSHSVFPTYYLEFAFTFNSLNKVAAYNVQDDSSAQGFLYYQDFTVDVTGLLDSYTLHFDLYNEVAKKGVYKVGDFAPFSHDAESGHPHEVPDQGSTSLLISLGFGLLGLVAWFRRKAAV